MDQEYARTRSDDTENRNSDCRIDHQIQKIHYPRDNNEKVLSFCLQEEPNLSLDFNSLTIGCRVKIPSSHYPDNGLSAKLFRNMNIEVNSQLITSTKSSNELPLLDYITTIANFSSGYVTSALYPQGYFDLWNVNTR